MRTFYCECGQPLTLVAAGVPGTALSVSDDAVTRMIDEAFDRHLPYCVAAAVDEAEAS